MKIAASTLNGNTHLITEDGVDLSDIPRGEAVPSRVLRAGPNRETPRLSRTGEVRNALARIVYFDEPADADLNALLAKAEVQGAPADEIGEVPADVAKRFTGSDSEPDTPA
jgi:hypothetical protein